MDRVLSIGSSPVGMVLICSLGTVVAVVLTVVTVVMVLLINSLSALIAKKVEHSTAGKQEEKHS